MLFRSRNPRECAVAKVVAVNDRRKNGESQPARMRCGKVVALNRQPCIKRRNPRECAVAKLKPVVCAGVWLSSQPARMRCGKISGLVSPRLLLVATRTNALWQRIVAAVPVSLSIVATRTNALWQSLNSSNIALNVASQPARMRCGKDRS